MRAVASTKPLLLPWVSACCTQRSEDAAWGLESGKRDADDFWILEGDESSTGVHVAFVAGDRTAAVDSFHSAALGAGGRDNGAPGLRPEYHEGYYGAFVLDPDGNNIEAVHHEQ